jgi:hypothetical protein
MNTITIRQLRGILFGLDNQDMTVKELRELLFYVESQDDAMGPMDIQLAVRHETELVNSATFKKMIAKREAA